MKLRLLAMATVAAAALSTPALAGDGWYLGLGGGYDEQSGIRGTSVAVPAATGKVGSTGSGIGEVSIGYAWADTGWRLENEFAFTQHSISAGATSFSASAAGGDQITSDMVNLAYDIPLGDTWKLSLGGGVGVGGFRGALTTTGTNFDILRGGQTSFQWQLIGGLSVAIAPDVDLFGEYRYRENELNSSFRSSYTNFTPIHVAAVSENVAMFGLRWYLTPPFRLQPAQVSSVATEVIQEMKSVRRSFSLNALCLAFACMLLGVMSNQTARAQASPAPIGTWANKTEGLVVQQSGTCGFLVNGKVAYSGTCKWETPSAKGGILDLVYPMPLAPGHIRWSVIYVNKTTITLDGDVFYKQGN